ncbi:IS66 family insertion sequence element accessory protein TnpB [Hyphomonas sp.]|uniref:IS66 family insertion sequence element accessory protein TnpA n=1 Tax=Hyphomonas sp. TaxID=87 RepID=UPI0035635FC2
MSEKDLLSQRLPRVDARGRVRTEPEERESILDEFERSGTSGAGFARLHGIKYATFSKWVRKRRRQRQSEQASQEAGGGGASALTLAEVVLAEQALSPAQQSAEALRVELPSAATIVITNRRQVQLAAELLRELASC